jgi:hypothetical protein
LILLEKFVYPPIGARLKPKLTPPRGELLPESKFGFTTGTRPSQLFQINFLKKENPVHCKGCRKAHNTLQDNANAPEAKRYAGEPVSQEHV